MAFVDLPLDQLRAYNPEVAEPADFDAFWERTLDDARTVDLAPEFVAVDVGLSLLDVYDVTYSGFAGQRVRGWLILPKGHGRPRPCVVSYIGYGGGRGLPVDHLLVAAAGYAQFIMDTRGQGSGWSPGATPDIDPYGDPSADGFLTRGLSHPDHYYYRRVFTDAVRAVEAARAHPAIDGRIVVQGGSQGGGIALAVAGLVPDLAGAYIDQPFLCHYERAATLTDAEPYHQIARYASIHTDTIEQMFGTLSYFDGVNFAKRANTRARFTVGLMDAVCPPSTIFAAYNRCPSEKDMTVWTFNGHDGGNSTGRTHLIKFLHSVLA